MKPKITTDYYLTGLLVSILFLSSCANNKHTDTKTEDAIPVIFETDMGNDIDDALALAMLNNYIDDGKVNLLAVMSNKDNPYSAEYIDIVDTWYGHPDIPIGKVVNGKTPHGPTYCKDIVDRKEDGSPVFKRTVTTSGNLPDAVNLYRSILQKAADTSVIIISVGFSTNLARLLKSAPDSISPLSGKELVRRKVRLLSMMAGCFNDTIPKEYNIYNDVDAAFTLFAMWPGPIVVSPYEVGIQILYPAGSIENDFDKNNPVADAYKAFMKMPYDRPCWDLTSALYAVEPDSAWFTLSPRGDISVDTLTAQTFFTPRPEGQHRYLLVDPAQEHRILQRVVTVVTEIGKKNP